MISQTNVLKHTLLMPKQFLSMSHLNKSWVLLSSTSTGKLLRAVPANQSGEKPALARSIKSREGNCSFESVLEVFYPFPEEKGKHESSK